MPSSTQETLLTRSLVPERITVKDHISAEVSILKANPPKIRLVQSPIRQIAQNDRVRELRVERLPLERVGDVPDMVAGIVGDADAGPGDDCCAIPLNGAYKLTTIAL